jgi:hypothetical protein
MRRRRLHVKALYLDRAGAEGDVRRVEHGLTTIRRSSGWVETVAGPGTYRLKKPSSRRPRRWSKWRATSFGTASACSLSLR